MLRTKSGVREIGRLGDAKLGFLASSSNPSETPAEVRTGRLRRPRKESEIAMTKEETELDVGDLALDPSDSVNLEESLQGSKLNASLQGSKSTFHLSLSKFENGNTENPLEASARSLRSPRKPRNYLQKELPKLEPETEPEPKPEPESQPEAEPEMEPEPPPETQPEPESESQPEAEPEPEHDIPEPESQPEAEPEPKPEPELEPEPTIPEQTEPAVENFKAEEKPTAEENGSMPSSTDQDPINIDQPPPGKSTHKIGTLKSNFEGRRSTNNKNGDPPHRPRPPANVAQKPLLVKADYKPPSYEKSRQEEKQIGKALSECFAFKSMPRKNMMALFASF